MPSASHRAWIVLWTVVWLQAPLGAAVLDDVLILKTPQAEAAKTVPEPASPPVEPSLRHHTALGISYTGFQLRYQPTSRWAAEGRMQFGKADSDYGTVRAQVYGLRVYRFYPVRKWDNLSWYLGGEGAYAKADTGTSNYATKGIAAGAYGGLEYRLASRVSLGADIGPYVISLKESQTGLTSTNMDFVVNTNLTFYLF